MHCNKMSFKLKRMKRTIILSLLSFVLVLFLMLNLMMVQLHSSTDPKEQLEIFPKEGKISEIIDHNIDKAQIRRKPKTANFDETDNEISPSNNENIMSHNILAKVNLNVDIQKDLEKNNIQDDQMVEDMESIDDLYKEDDYDDDYGDDLNDADDDGNDDADDNDEDDNDDEYDYDDNIDQQYNHKRNMEKNEIVQYSNNLKTNPVFKPGDFGDIRGLEFYRKPKLKVEELPNDKADPDKVSEAEQTTAKPTEKHVLIENGIYWSSYVETQVPKGLSYKNITKWIREIRNTPVRSLQAPTWDRCGRDKNAYATLVDNSNLCARYRHPHHALVFGEVLSFYLSRLLGMDNVPGVVLATTNSTSRQWRATNFTQFEWEDNVIVALIQWIDNLNSRIHSKAVIPELILQAYRTGKPIRAEDIYRSVNQTTKSTHIPEIVQWGSMFLFDFLTGNYDRVASMQDSAEHDNKPSIMEEPIRNLRKSAKDGKLWLVDNESGLFDAYDVLRNVRGDYTTSRFSVFHQQTLQTMCVFQAHVIRALKKLGESSAPHERLLNYALSMEPLLTQLPRNDKNYKNFASLFPHRVKMVLNWVEKCQSFSKVGSIT